MNRRSNLLAFALLAAVFASGGAAGWAAARWSTDPRPRIGRGPEGMAEYLAGRLELTAAQRASVRAVLDRHHAEMQAIWGAVRPRFDSLRAVVREEIRAQLTPAQQERYLRLLADLEHQHGEHERRDTTTSTEGRP